MNIDERLIKISEHINEIQKDLEEVTNQLGEYEYNNSLHNMVLKTVPKISRDLEVFAQHIVVIKNINDLEVLKKRIYV